MTRAKQLFNEITQASSPADFIEQMIRDRRAETEYLEFKGGKTNSKDARRLWSKALSGFANTEGGVLIWGVRTDPTPSLDDPRINVDVAVVPEYIENPMEFAE